jgi:hypothetical protein
MFLNANGEESLLVHLVELVHEYCVFAKAVAWRAIN